MKQRKYCEMFCMNIHVYLSALFDITCKLLLTRL